MLKSCQARKKFCAVFGGYLRLRQRTVHALAVMDPENAAL
jgi:hypothetical protein